MTSRRRLSRTRAFLCSTWLATLAAAAACSSTSATPDEASPTAGGEAGTDARANAVLTDGPLADDGSTDDGSTNAADGAFDDVDADGHDGGNAPLCDVRDHGALGDGTTDDHAAIQATIASCPPGGVVYLGGAGKRYLTGTVVLASNLTLRIGMGAAIVGITVAQQPDGGAGPDNADLELHYPTIPGDSNTARALIYANNAQNIVIEAEGDGDAGNRGAILGQSDAAVWQHNGAKVPEGKRPMLVYTAGCQNVTVRNIDLRDSPMWTLVSRNDQQLVIENMSVTSQNGENQDGIDIINCQHVTVAHVVVRAEDDGICLKSPAGGVVEDVQVTDSLVLGTSGGNGLKLGTESYGGFKDIHFARITVGDVLKSAMAVEAVQGADISNVSFTDIDFANVGSPFYVIHGDRDTMGYVGSIDGVTFQRITGGATKNAWGSAISGTQLPDGGVLPVKNVTFTQVSLQNKKSTRNFGADAGCPYHPSSWVQGDPCEYGGEYPDGDNWGDLPAQGFFVRHATGVTFTNVTVTDETDPRPQIVQRDTH